MRSKSNAKDWQDRLTETPGVYQRADHFRVVFRPDGDRRVAKRFETYEEARGFKLGLPGRPRQPTDRYPAYLLADPCAYCGRPSESFDHIDPRVTGGDDEWTNLTGACVSCNSSKREKPLLLFLLDRLRAPDDTDLFALLGV